MHRLTILVALVGTLLEPVEAFVSVSLNDAGISFVGAQRTAPILSEDGIPQQAADRIRPLQAARRSSSDGSSHPPLARFLTLVYKGMTFPFPTLRQLATQTQKVVEDDDTDSKKRVGFSLRESLLAIAAYLILGAVSYHSTILQHESAWSIVDALYFSVVTFTTVGYGDLCPTTGAGKIFTILFGLSGISILGTAIATIGSRLMEAETDMIQQARAVSRQRLLNFWNSTTITTTTKEPEAIDAKNTTQTESSEKPLEPPGNLWRHTLQSLVRKSIPAFSALVMGGLWMGRLEGWSILDSIYYSFITAGTLGYGDFSPVSRPGRLWGILFIPLSVAAAGEVLGNVASTLLERRQEKFYESLLQKELNMTRLLEMDTDNNGKVSREEYVEFMLKEMQLVSADQFDELHAQFQKLDVDGGGFLDKKDIEQLLVEKQSP